MPSTPHTSGVRNILPNVLFQPSPSALTGWFAVRTVPACCCGCGCRKAFGSAGLGSNKRHGGVSQAVGLRATEQGCPCETEVPFCMPILARQYLAFSVVCFACGFLSPFSGKTEWRWLFRCPTLDCDSPTSCYLSIIKKETSSRKSLFCGNY